MTRVLALSLFLLQGIPAQQSGTVTGVLRDNLGKPVPGIRYFTYYKPVAGSNTHGKATLARARFDGGYAIADVRDIFSTDALTDGPSAARAVFGRDGKIYMAIGIPIPRSGSATVFGNAPIATMTDAQDPKLLRQSAPTQ